MTYRDLRVLIEDTRNKLNAATREADTASQRCEEIAHELDCYLCTLGALEEQFGDRDNGLAPKVIRNEAYNILQNAGTPLHWRELYLRIEARGIAIPGKNPERNFSAHLSNDDRFVSLGEGMWTTMRGKAWA